MPLVDRLNRVAEVVEHACKCLEAPAFATLGFPPLAVILKRTERNEGIVRRASSQDLGT
jgi:hypothetical protein